jgi:hypothetical protein
MGRGSRAACLDCKQAFDFGYGSYTTWRDYGDTVAEYDANIERSRSLKRPVDLPDCAGDLAKNKAYRAFLVLHEGHQFVKWFEDFASEVEKDGRELVTADFDDDRVIADITGFEFFMGQDDGTLKPLDPSAK